MSHIKPQKVHQDFIRVRRRILKQAWEEKKARLIAEGVPADSLEIPHPRKKTGEQHH